MCMQGKPLTAEFIHLVQQGEAQLAQMFAAAAARGEIRPIDPELAALTVSDLTRGLMERRCATGAVRLGPTSGLRLGRFVPRFRGRSLAAGSIRERLCHHITQLLHARRNVGFHHRADLGCHQRCTLSRRLDALRNAGVPGRSWKLH